MEPFPKFSEELDEEQRPCKKSRQSSWKSSILPNLSSDVLLEYLFDNFQDTIVVYQRCIGSDDLPLFSGVNKKGQETIGKPSEEILGRSNAKVFGDVAFAKEMDAAVKKCCDYRQGFAWKHEVGGKHFETTYTYQRAAEEGSEYVLGFCRDISDSVWLQKAERERREAERATETKSLFLARMSHDLRTPLMGVLNTADLLGMSELNKDQQDQVNILKASSQVLLTLSNDITDLARVEQGKVQLKAETMDLKDCLKLTIDFCNYRAKQAGVNLSFLYDQALSLKLRQDTTRVRQIVYNVLFNAIKYTPSGGSVTVDVKSMEGPPNFAKSVLPEFLTVGSENSSQDKSDTTGNKTSTTDGNEEKKALGDNDGCTIAKTSALWVQVDIIDTGVGIPHELQEKIFQPFSQVPNAKQFGGRGQENNGRDDYTPSEERGTGLGLAISSGLCSSLGGKLSLVSSSTTGPSTGSRFRVTLPFGRTTIPRIRFGECTTSETKSSSPEDEFIAEKISQLNVLIADDHPVNRKILRRLLEMIGVKDISVVCDGVEALAAFANTPRRFDVVLMDVHMPNMDGIEAVNKLRKMLPEKEWPYVVMLTANAMTGDVEDCYDRCSPNEYMTKPIQQDQLRKCLRNGVIFSEARNHEPT